MKRKKVYSVIISFILTFSITAGLTGCGYQELSSDYNPNYDFLNNDNNENDDPDLDEGDEKNQDDWDDEFGNNDDPFNDDQQQDDNEKSYNLSDQWGFTNSGLDKKIGVSGYYITTTDYKKLISQLNEQEKANISYTAPYYDDNRNLINKQTYDRDYTNPDHYASHYEDWGGSCFGMSVSTVLKNDGVISASDLNAGSALNSSNVNANDVSAINFYHWQQRLIPCRTARNTFGALDAREQVSRLISQAQSGKPFTVDMFWKDKKGNDSGHTVVGYGIETGGNWTVNWSDGTSDKYNARILIYDCSYNNGNNNDSEEKHYIYVNPDNGSWCNPAWGVRSTTNNITNLSNDNGEFGAIMSSTDFLNAVSYIDGTPSTLYENNAEEASIATLYMSSNKKMDIKTSSGMAEIDGLRTVKSTYGEKLNTAADTAGKINTIQVFIPQGEDSYEFSSGDNLNFGLDVGNMFISSKAEAGGTITLDADGTYTAKYDSDDANAQITVTSNDDTAFGIDDCGSIEIEAPGTSNLQITQNSTGIKVNGGDLSKLSITGNLIGQEIKIDSATDGKSVEITKDISGNNIIAKADTDGDGKYDKTISKTKVPKKTKQKITLKKKSLNIKAGKTASLKAKAKTSISYAKVSGNKKIAVSAKGKIKVAKSVRKGTYKIKVKMTAKATKKYKKAKKTFTIKVKVK